MNCTKHQRLKSVGKISQTWTGKYQKKNVWHVQTCEVCFPVTDERVSAIFFSDILKIPLVLHISSNTTNITINEVMVDVLVKYITSSKLPVLSKQEQAEINQQENPAEKINQLLGIMQQKSGAKVDSFIGLLNGFPLSKGASLNSQNVNNDIPLQKITQEQLWIVIILNYWKQGGYM